jgi:hypothetical protein
VRNAGLAKITFAFKNDNEEFRRLFTPGHPTKPMTIDAEETKTRHKTVTLHANLEDFLRVLNGPNPRLLIHMTAVPN